MSNKAVGWAMEQPLPCIPKLILIILADHYNGETGQCNPSVKRLCEVTGVIQRTIERHIPLLESQGLLTIVPKYRDDGSRTSNQYDLHLGGVAQTPGGVPKSPQTAADSRQVASQSRSSEPGREPGILEPGKELIKSENPNFRNISPNSENGSGNGNGSEVWPDYYATLYGIPGFKTPLNHVQEWLAKNNISVERAETTAYALKSKWPGPVKNPYRDPWATFQNWAKRPPLALANSTGPPRVSRAEPIRNWEDFPDDGGFGPPKAPEAE